MEKQTICQRAKAMLEPIPDDKIIASFLSIIGGKGCPEGWLNGLEQGLNEPSQYGGFANKVNNYLIAAGKNYISYVANDRRAEYPQDTPKARTMAFLDDCIASGL